MACRTFGHPQNNSALLTWSKIMFLPTTRAEIEQLGWQNLDIILITGDAYIDCPQIGVAVIGKVLLDAGFRVGIIAQPDTKSPADIRRLGEPQLFWGVTGGCIDSMVANYTATLRRRQKDDYTPGGLNNRRPDRAVIAYVNLIRQSFKSTRPVVVGGIEASLRRMAHYDYWSDKIRRSILLDAKADWLVYGMGERTVVELAQALLDKRDPRPIRGLCYSWHSVPPDYIKLPSFETVVADRHALIHMFQEFYQNNDALQGHGLAQKYGDRYVIQNPPSLPLTQMELDAVFDLDFERRVHPFYAQQGPVKALETIQFSVLTHRGCYGECNFCAISVHEGRTVQWRSPQAILREVRRMTRHPDFRGIIADVGGPTANMYGFECPKKIRRGICPTKRCIFPVVCPTLPVNHQPQLALLRQIRRIKGVRRVFVASGLRYDLLLHDRRFGIPYLAEITRQHVSGQLKIAPEHTQPQILKRMGKPISETLLDFKMLFDRLSKEAGKKQFLTYYLIAAHPGCTLTDMQQMQKFFARHLHINPEQVQIFTPLPSTYSALMYHTGLDPCDRTPIFIEKSLRGKQQQKAAIQRCKTTISRTR